jgi:hypothetical protein
VRNIFNLSVRKVDGLPQPDSDSVSVSVSASASAPPAHLLTMREACPFFLFGAGEQG